MVLARFLPRDEQFFDQFEDAGVNAAEVAEVLARVVANGADREIVYSVLCRITGRP